MNTNAIAKLLGVSQSTIKRWVKQLDLRMERNDQGHYLFTDEDIELLKDVQVQLQNGAILQDIHITNKKQRKGAIKQPANEVAVEKLVTKINEIERGLEQKADSVTSYQLLQHRREIEELQDEVESLHDRIELLELILNKKNNHYLNEVSASLETSPPRKKTKKKKIISVLFGF